MYNHTLENQKLKQELTRYKQILGNIPYIDDSLFKGGYRVVRNLKERDAIPYCYRKYGMKVVVVGNEEDGLFREYILNSENLLNVWKEVIVEVPITEVTEDIVDLVEDYSELAEDLETQRDLNLVLKALILQLQQDIQNVEVPTKTSDLINDGEDGLNPFITAQDIPPIPGQVNADWNATSGPSEILNKPTIPAPVDISTKAETNASNITGLHTISWRDALDIYSKSQVDTALNLKLNKPLAPDNVPTKVILGDGTTKNLSEITTDISGKEDKSNKQNNLTPDGTGIKYPTVDAVNNGLNTKLDKPSTPNNVDTRVILADGTTKLLSEITQDLLNSIKTLNFHLIDGELVVQDGSELQVLLVDNELIIN